MSLEQAVVFREHPIEWTDEKVARIWDYFARTSNTYFSQVFGARILRKSGLRLQQELRVLDFGCGPGFMWEHLQSLGAKWEYTGLDFSPETVQILRRKAQGHPLFAGVQLVSQLPTDVDDQAFDVVLLTEVVEHLKDDHLDGTLREAARTLKKGGSLLVTTPNQEDLSASTQLCPDCGALFHVWQHVRSWSVASLSAEVEQFGFKLHTAHTLDLGVHGPLRTAIHLGRKLLGRPKLAPHMIAVFERR